MSNYVTTLHKSSSKIHPIGINISEEIDGKNENFDRPVLILRKFNEDILWILPITSREKEGEYFYKLNIKKIKGTVLLYQIKMICIKRLRRLITRLDQKEFDAIKKRTIELINENPPSPGEVSQP